MFERISTTLLVTLSILGLLAMACGPLQTFIETWDNIAKANGSSTGSGLTGDEGAGATVDPGNVIDPAETPRVVEVTRIVTVNDSTASTSIAPTVEPTAPSTVEPTAPPAVEPTAPPPPPTAPPPPPPQPTLEVGLPSNFGDVALTAGFVPDPYEVAVVGGGDVDVGALGLGANCYGYATSAPDYELTWSGASSEMSIVFTAANGGDATLIVNDPYGNWHCSDDVDGFNPALVFANPTGGVYDIWVGSYYAGDVVGGTLGITELDHAPPTGLDYTLPSNYGSVALAAGFLPDPHEVAVTAGGDVDVGELGLGANCYGHATSAPDYELTWSGASSEMSVFFTADNGGDATLIVNDPNGNWHCSDDVDGLNPALVFNNPAEGVYDIWVGSYYGSEHVDGTLGITEYDLTVGNSDDTGGTVANERLDYTLPTNYGSVALEAGFLPDPHEANVIGGGHVDVGALELGSCYGHATSAPDYELTWSGASSEMSIVFTARNGGDATLIVNDPYGNWHCSDDFDGLNPALVFNNPAEGVYDIWVGSFYADAYVDGALGITEFDVSP